MDANFKRLTSVKGEPYFTLEAANHKVVGVSEMYSSAQARETGIEAVKRVAPGAEVVDERFETRGRPCSPGADIAAYSKIAVARQLRCKRPASSRPASVS